MEKSQSGKVVYLPHEDTPKMQELRRRGYGILNDVISQLELKRLNKAKGDESVAG
jgi:heterodisulfide reductase subunit A-like polyferredoxin